MLHLTLEQEERNMMANLGQMLAELKAKRNDAKKDLEKLDEAIRVLQKLGGTNSKGASAKGAKPRRKMSAAARRKIAAAQRARWARVRKQKAAA
jgi:hypothetical protein